MLPSLYQTPTGRRGHGHRGRRFTVSTWKYLPDPDLSGGVSVTRETGEDPLVVDGTFSGNQSCQLPVHETDFWALVETLCPLCSYTGT